MIGAQSSEKTQLTVLKAGRQACEQTSSAQALYRMHSGIFPIFFFASSHRSKKVENITDCNYMDEHQIILGRSWISFFFLFSPLDTLQKLFRCELASNHTPEENVFYQSCNSVSTGAGI